MIPKLLRALHRLAPERQHIAIELLNRLSQPPSPQPAFRSSKKP